MKASFFKDKKIERFIAIRLIIYLLVTAFLCIIFLKGEKNIVIGLILGTFLSAIKFFATANVYRKLLNQRTEKLDTILAVIKVFAGILGTATVLIVSILSSVTMFAGTAAGVLGVPLIITLNSLTEGLGVTHNNFE